MGCSASKKNAVAPDDPGHSARTPASVTGTAQTSDTAPELEVLTELVQAWKPTWLDFVLGKVREDGEVFALGRFLELARDDGVAQELLEPGAHRWQELSGNPLSKAVQGTDIRALFSVWGGPGPQTKGGGAH